MIGSNSEYGIAPSWQRAMGFWNMTIFFRIVVISLIVGGIGFRTNYLLGFIEDGRKMIR